ncbi:hypothetical protein HUG20_16840 [Salicibibacter cibi]|uniref:Uncharacterized protein n=1 Tax=Salicibibacter cibi TaxID=2743001 RepID=A0A7T6ZDJ0_9BACI|nr:hypothetical protein [Salicibibacter cibi]QQK81411.1 hypothetical protein HUG20_16840 [Salicibibacter cibi]
MKALKNVLVTSLSVTLFAILLTIMADVYQWWALASYSPTATEEVIDEGILISVGVFSLITTVFMLLELIALFQNRCRTRGASDVKKYFLPKSNGIKGLAKVKSTDPDTSTPNHKKTGETAPLVG